MSICLEKAKNVSGANSRLAQHKCVVNEIGEHEVRVKEGSDHILWFHRT